MAASSSSEAEERGGRLRGPIWSLAERMRPKSLEKVEGQEHLIGSPSADGPLVSFLKARPSACIWLHGPPGCGKTSLAVSIAQAFGKNFLGLVYDSDLTLLYQVLEEAKKKTEKERIPSVVFVKNLTRFDRDDQEIILPYLTRGDAVLYGSSGQSPHSFVTPSLLTLCQIFELRPLRHEHIKRIINYALHDPLNGLLQFFPNLVVHDDIIDYICSVVHGNAKLGLDVFEVASLNAFDRSHVHPHPQGMLGLLDVLKSRCYLQEYEYLKPFKRFQEGKQVKAGRRHAVMPPCVIVTLDDVNNALNECLLVMHS